MTSGQPEKTIKFSSEITPANGNQNPLYFLVDRGRAAFFIGLSMLLARCLRLVFPCKYKELVKYFTGLFRGLA